MKEALHIVAVIALATSALITVSSCAAMAAARQVLIRVHFVGPPATLGAALLVLAQWLDGAGLKDGLKAALVALVIALGNAVVSHATARAIWIREVGGWPPDAQRFRKEL